MEDGAILRECLPGDCVVALFLAVITDVMRNTE